MFRLHCGGQDSSVAYTSVRCNGRGCVEAARPRTRHLTNGQKKSHPTKPSTTRTGDGSSITKVSASEAGDARDITKASDDKDEDVKEAGVVVTRPGTVLPRLWGHPALGPKTPAVTPSTAERKRSPKRRSGGRNTRTPRMCGVPYTWKRGFVDGTGMCPRRILRLHALDVLGRILDLYITLQIFKSKTGKMKITSQTETQNEPK